MPSDSDEIFVLNTQGHSYTLIWKANISSESEGIFAIRGHFASVPVTNALVRKLQCFCPQIQTSNYLTVHPAFFQVHTLDLIFF